jgi:hypothetical protein
MRAHPAVAPRGHLRYATQQARDLWRSEMADHGELEYATATGNDLPAHVASYEKFVHFIFVGLVHVVNILLGLAIGGVHGAWLVAFGVFVIATIAAIINLVNGNRGASIVVLVLSVIALFGTA